MRCPELGELERVIGLLGKEVDVRVAARLTARGLDIARLYRGARQSRRAGGLGFSAACTGWSA